jgi:hypothetical protein
MQERIIFMIHGMGDQDATWHQASAAALRSRYENPIYTHREYDFLSRYRVLPLSYYDILERYRKQWAEGPQQILDLLGGDEFFKESIPANERSSTLDSIYDSVETVRAGDSFFWTHILDVLLYRFSIIVRAEVNLEVGKQIAQGLDDYPNRHSWSIVARSLGTSVIHNVLNALYTEDTFLDRPRLRPDHTRPLVLAMVANVSRVLQLPNLKVLRSPVRPGGLAEGALCWHYLNCRHKYDPLTWFKPFDPDDGLWLDALGQSRYIHARPEIMKQLNVHDCIHYLNDPDVHVPLFRMLEGKLFISDGQLNKARSEHREGSTQDATDKWRDAMEEIKIHVGKGLWGFIKAIYAYYKALAD